MASATVLRAVVVLRILTLLVLAASVVVMGLNNLTIGGFKVTFKDIIAYRYVLAIGAVGFVYTLIQMPFAMYNMVQEKRMIRNGCLQHFDLYGDQVMALLLASGVGVGFGVSCELKRGVEDHEVRKFFDMAILSSGLLLAGCILMAQLCIVASNRRQSTSSKGFFR